MINIFSLNFSSLYLYEEGLDYRFIITHSPKYLGVNKNLNNALLFVLTGSGRQEEGVCG